MYEIRPYVMGAGLSLAIFGTVPSIRAVGLAIAIGSGVGVVETVVQRTILMKFRFPARSGPPYSPTADADRQER